MRETDLYPPVKIFLENLGYTVKAEVGPADVMAVKDGGAPVFVELKTAFSLTLFHQGIARQGLSDAVYLAVPRPAGKAAGKAIQQNVRLARRLGLGVLVVRLADGRVEVMCDPGPYAPRKTPRKAARLMEEFLRRRGDPNLGGARGARMTAYRQDALVIAAHLMAHGPCRGAAVCDATGVGQATRIMRDNHYGWFDKVETGVYAISDTGRAAVA